MLLMYRDGIHPVKVKSNMMNVLLEEGFTLEAKKEAPKKVSDSEKVAENKAVLSRVVAAEEDSSDKKRTYTKKDSK